MWCDHCQEEIVPVAGKNDSSIQECSQCGKALVPVEGKGSEPAAADQSGSSSIAQTAHALLKRWEASRPVSESMSTSEPDAAPETATDKAVTSRSPLETARSGKPASFPAKSETEQKTISAGNSNIPSDNIFDDIPSGLDVSEMLPDLVSPAKPELKSSSFLKDQTKKTEQKKAASISAAPSPRPSSSKTEASQTETATTRTDSAKQKQSQPAGATLAAQNDAGSLLNRSVEPPAQRKTQSASTENKKQAEASTSPETQSEKPGMFKTKSKVKQVAQPVVDMPESVQGRVRFTPPGAHSANKNDEKIDDLGIQQAIERHHRQQRNWSVLFAQLMVYGGALAMTCGIAIVIVNWFGSIEITETTGWLTLAGGHLLFVLGIYTHLSSKMEQVWSEMHARHDELARLLNQSRSRAESGKNKPAASAAENVSFQRKSIPETVREVA